MQSAQALPGHCVSLRWADGWESVVDLGPLLAKGGVFAFLRDPAAFSAFARSARPAAPWSGTMLRATRSISAPTSYGALQGAVEAA